LALDPFAFEEDGLSAPEVDVSRGKIVEALVIAGMVVMRHEGGDLAFEIAGQVVVLKRGDLSGSRNAQRHAPYVVSVCSCPRSSSTRSSSSPSFPWR